jgi:hypothetical protein
MKKKEKIKRTVVCLKPNLHAKVKELSSKEFVPMEKIVEQAIEAYFEKKK